MVFLVLVDSSLMWWLLLCLLYLGLAGLATRSYMVLHVGSHVIE